MSTTYPRSKRARIGFTLGVALLALFVASIQPVAAQEDFGQRAPNQNVYDQTGLLTPDEVSMLEQLAAEVEEAGAPVVVYLQARDTDFEETLQDGRELMEAWDVQSEPGARDGVVIFLNLEPDDLRHGQLALVAGEAHFDGGDLPQYQLDRIASEMRSILADEETASGIARGLEMIAGSLTTGPPPPPEPSRAEEIADTLSSGPISPLNIVSVILTGGLIVFMVRAWQSRPISDRPSQPTIEPPGDVMPAIVGALVDGRVNDLEMEATILDLARRNALAIEPEDDEKKVQLRLLDSGVLQNNFERQVWSALEREVDGDGLITSKNLANVRSHWGPAKEALQAGLETRGWYDPKANERRIPLYVAGASALLLAAVAFVLFMIGLEPWSLVGIGALSFAGISALNVGSRMPGTTLEGEHLAQPWRGYLEGLKSARDDRDRKLNLDLAVPYAVAMNARGAVDKRLKQASEAGYAPVWLGSTQGDAWGAAGFYPYWAAFHAGVSPTVGTGAGGAAAGSGGAGGGF